MIQCYFQRKRKFCILQFQKQEPVPISVALQNYDHIHRNKVLVNGNIVALTKEHTKPLEVKKYMNENFDDFKKVAFVRNPWSKAVSSYFFYKNGRASRNIWKRDGLFLRKVVNVLLAKFLPFRLWLRFHPLRQCADFLCDKDGKLLVDKIYEIQENMQESFEELCHDFHVEVVEIWLKKSIIS